MIGRLVRRIRARVAVAARAMLPVAALGVATLAAPGGARADLFDFSYSGAGISAMGTFTATLTSTPDRYTITGITGERNNVQIANLIADNGYEGNDNYLFYPTSSGYLDSSGVSYSAGGVSYNVFYTGTYTEDASGGASTGLTSFIVTVPAPIPGGGLLSFLAAGLAGLGYLAKSIVGFGRRRILAKKPSAEPA